MKTSDEMTDDSRFQVTSKKEILSILNGMMRRTQLLTLSVNGGQTILTTILAIDESSNEIIIDAAKTASENQLITSSSTVHIEAVQNNIRINFKVGRPTLSNINEQPAFRISVPESVTRLQRRESFRVPAPITKPLSCIIPMLDPEGNVTKVRTYLNNISAGGVALTDESMELDGAQGLVYKKCELQLSEKIVVDVDLEVRDCNTVTLSNGKTVNRFGMAFQNMTNQTAATIQRYIMQLERDQNAKKSGML